MRSTTRLGLVAALLLSVAVPAFADYDLYLEIPELGEIGRKLDDKPADPATKNWIKIRSFGIVLENPPPTGRATSGAGAGKAKLTSITIVKDFDAVSPLLFQALATGGHYATARILAVQTATGTAGKTKPPVIQSQIELTMVALTKIEVAGNARVGDAPSEAITLTAGALKFAATGPSAKEGTPGTEQSFTFDFTGQK